MPKPKPLVREIMEVLKEQRALFALMLAYAGAIAAALFSWGTLTEKYLALSQGGSVWLFYAFAFFPVLMPAAVVIIRRWRRASLEQRLADIGPSHFAIKHGHFRTAPYEATEEDRAAYQRTDGAHEEALKRIRAAAAKGEPFFFLHSQSGCGKTSLLQAFALPAVEHAGWRVVALRGFTGIVSQLAEALGLVGSAPMWEMHAALVAESAARLQTGGTLLVAVDQFEEFLILHPPGSPAWNGMGRWLTGLRRAPVAGLLMLFSLRSEYQALALKLGLPDFDSTRSFVVPLFTAEHARDFLRRGLEGSRKKTGELPLDQFIRQMEDRDDARGMVRPIQANLVGHAYRTFAAEFHRRLLAGQRVDFLADWLQRLLERRELRLHARPVFEGLLQKDGSRRPARVAEIAEEAELETEVVRHCLNAFEKEGLVRCLTPELDDDKQKLWEISHDFLAVQLKRLLSFWRRLWQENLASTAAPAGIALWLLLALGFVMQDAERKARVHLQDFGVEWRADVKRAAIRGDFQDEFTEGDLAAAEPFLRMLGCRELDLSGCESLRNVDSLKRITTLTGLNLSGCLKVQNLDPLRELTALTRLNITQCNKIESLDALRKLEALTRLSVVDCEKLQNIDGISGLTALTSLQLSNMSTLQSVDALKSLTALTQLAVVLCSSLKHVDGLRGLTSLTEVDLLGCYKLESVDGLKELKAVRRLNLSYCPSVPPFAVEQLKAALPDAKITYSN